MVGVCGKLHVCNAWCNNEENVHALLIIHDENVDIEKSIEYYTQHGIDVLSIRRAEMNLDDARKQVHNPRMGYSVPYVMIAGNTYISDYCMLCYEE